jgi:serine/threonine-protein kinase RsbW/sigma-B regulation protein RsbU (phosphoserine phosphatase)
MEARVTIHVDAGAMQQVRGFVTDFVAQHAIAAEEQSRILIVLEELITNLTKYGYPNRLGGSAEVALQLNGTQLTIEFADDGDPFDPLNRPPPNLSSPLEERDLGGLGIHIVRALADEARYCRVDQRNVLRLTRRVALIKS